MLTLLRDKKRASVEKGFTMIEVLLAMTILAVGMLGIATLAGTAIKSSSYSRAITQANNFAQDRLETLQSIDYNNLESTDTTTSRTDLRRNCSLTDANASRPVYTCTPVTATRTLDGRDFTWSYTVTLIDLDGNGDATQHDGLKRLDVTVSWTDQLWQTTRSVEVATLTHRG